jgi:hypothetical protein
MHPYDSTGNTNFPTQYLIAVRDHSRSVELALRVSPLLLWKHDHQGAHRYPQNGSYDYPE